MQICIIEDDKSVCDLIEMALSNQGHQFISYQSPEDALEKQDFSAIDLILLDCMMPEISGVELLKLFREKNIEVPVIFITALDHLENKLEAFNRGADDYLVKPFNLEELGARINAVHRRYSKTPEGHSDFLVKGNLKLHHDSLKIESHGKSVDLTAKEYQLLRYLMLNPNKTVTRDFILQHLWGEDKQETDNSLNVLINRLRKKTGGSKSPVRTDWGKGYLFKAG